MEVLEKLIQLMLTYMAPLLILTIFMDMEPLDDPTPPSFNNLLSVMAMSSMDENPLPEPMPHPERGGMHISFNIWSK